MACSEVAAFLQTAGAQHILNVFYPMSLQFSVFNENNGRVAFIGIVTHNHFVLPVWRFASQTDEPLQNNLQCCLCSYKKINKKKIIAEDR